VYQNAVAPQIIENNICYIEQMLTKVSLM